MSRHWLLADGQQVHATRWISSPSHRWHSQQTSSVPSVQHHRSARCLSPGAHDKGRQPIYGIRTWWKPLSVHQNSIRRHQRRALLPAYDGAELDGTFAHLDDISVLRYDTGRTRSKLRTVPEGCRNEEHRLQRRQMCVLHNKTEYTGLCCRGW